MTRSLAELEKALQYNFKDKTLLEIALTHSSTGEKYNYERLEFLGDRVLGLIIASLLYDRFPEEKEGDLAKRLASLVQGTTLAKLSMQINLSDYINFSEAENAAGGAQNEHILADVFEAVIGALYRDGGYEPCRKLIEREWKDVLHVMKKPPQHPKTAVQEWAQAKGLPVPLYEIIDQTGPDHAPVFNVSMTLPGFQPVSAQGKSRAEAEKQAAKAFLKTIENEEK